ncbi:MAG: FCD domain-containing protein [Marinovum sp.]|nr:FCD domain-containing protein [Marinovum sp.]
MPFERIQSEKLSSAVVRQIELLILRGVLQPGDRLPAERDLAERMGVSRPSLRDALADLQSRGLLIAKANAGIFVADVLGSAFSPALVGLLEAYDDAKFDYLAFRRDMEGLAAERAARLASDTDLTVIQTIYDKMVMAHRSRSKGDEATLDAEFHLAIIEASHNVVMLHMMRSMYQLLRDGVFYNRQIMFRQSTTRETILEQHAAINAALQERNTQAARRAVEDHLFYVEAALRDNLRADAHEAIAQQRLANEKSR